MSIKPREALMKNSLAAFDSLVIPSGHSAVGDLRFVWSGYSYFRLYLCWCNPSHYKPLVLVSEFPKFGNWQLVDGRLA
jgi:hypothetical protein